MGNVKTFDLNTEIKDESPDFRTLGNNSSIYDSLNDNLIDGEHKKKRTSAFQKYRPRNIETFTVKKNNKIKIENLR